VILPGPLAAIVARISGPTTTGRTGPPVALRTRFQNRVRSSSVVFTYCASVNVHCRNTGNGCRLNPAIRCRRHSAFRQNHHSSHRNRLCQSRHPRCHSWPQS
ncbi:uncharacterized protein METZ01_LOCUS222716, partial [marine metagenome]